MDPLSQGVLGASVPQALARKERVRAAAIIGFFSGMMADLDVLIFSSEDPLLNLEYHRQFTHSLFFVPIGGLIGAAIFFLLRKIFRLGDVSYKECFIYATLGYATHGLLDACTTYGTQLFWPFSNMRVAWNYISIIDPIYTLPILIFVILGFVKRSSRWGLVAVVWGLCYMALGAYQHHRATEYAKMIAKSRGHEYLRIDAKPSFGNLLLWKLIYEADGHFYVDAVRILGEPVFFEGQKIAKLDIVRDFPGLSAESLQVRDIERFRWFSNDYLAIQPDDATLIGDVRYSLVPNEVKPLWAIKIDVNDPDRHVSFETSRDMTDRLKFMEMLGF